MHNLLKLKVLILDQFQNRSKKKNDFIFYF